MTAAAGWLAGWLAFVLASVIYRKQKIYSAYSTRSFVTVFPDLLTLILLCIPLLSTPQDAPRKYDSC